MTTAYSDVCALLAWVMSIWWFADLELNMPRKLKVGESWGSSVCFDAELFLVSHLASASFHRIQWFDKKDVMIMWSLQCVFCRKRIFVLWCDTTRHLHLMADATRGESMVGWNIDLRLCWSVTSSPGGGSTEHLVHHWDKIAVFSKTGGLAVKVTCYLSVPFGGLQLSYVCWEQEKLVRNCFACVFTLKEVEMTVELVCSCATDDSAHVWHQPNIPF